VQHGILNVGGGEFSTLKVRQWGVHRQGFAPRSADRRILLPLRRDRSQCGGDDNLYFRLVRCMLPKADAGEQGGHGDDGQPGSIGEAVAL
jgi:hypothetical protein